jgi:hypothetical protein
MQDRLEIDAGRTTRQILTFSYEAKEIWINARNNVEAELRPDGSLSDVKDAASKFASNVARVAALFLNCLQLRRAFFLLPAPFLRLTFYTLLCICFSFFDTSFW